MTKMEMFEGNDEGLSAKLKQKITEYLGEGDLNFEISDLGNDLKIKGKLKYPFSIFEFGNSIQFGSDEENNITVTLTDSWNISEFDEDWSKDYGLMLSIDQGMLYLYKRKIDPKSALSLESSQHSRLREDMLATRMGSSKRSISIPTQYKGQTHGLEEGTDTRYRLLLSTLESTSVGTVRNYKDFYNWAGDLVSDYVLTVITKVKSSSQDINELTAYSGSLVSVDVGLRIPHMLDLSNCRLIAQHENTWYVVSNSTIYKFSPKE